MERKEIVCEISRRTGVCQEQVEKTYYSMISIMADALSRGEEVNLNPEWGSFIPKLWDNQALNANSPRTRKVARYKIRFRPGNEIEKRLKILQDGDDKHQ